MAYSPRPAGPKNLREMFHYLWRNLSEISNDLGGGGGEPVHEHSHPNILDRATAGAHPISAITGLVAEQASQDAAIFANTKVFFQPNQPADLESSPGDIWFKEGYL